MFFACALASLLAIVLGWRLCTQLGHLGFWDQPNARSSHQRPTPRGGGLAFITGALLPLPLLAEPAGAALLLIPLPLAAVGLLDDRRGVPVHWRLAAQLATGLALAVKVGWTGPQALIAALLAAALINAINFMDGLDGLVASCLVLWLMLAGVLLQLTALLLLAAALLGFLLWNWSPARLFMGDVGSTYLGAVLAGALLRAGRTAGVEVLAGLLLVALPLLADAASCLLRRLLTGQPLWQAHRQHLYQRLQQGGWSHRRVALLYLLRTAALVALVWLVQALALPDPAALALMLASAGFMLILGAAIERRWAVAFEP